MTHIKPSGWRKRPSPTSTAGIFPTSTTGTPRRATCHGTTGQRRWTPCGPTAAFWTWTPEAENFCCPWVIPLPSPPPPSILPPMWSCAGRRCCPWVWTSGTRRRTAPFPFPTGALTWYSTAMGPLTPGRSFGCSGPAVCSSPSRWASTMTGSLWSCCCPAARLLFPAGAWPRWPNT